MLYYIILYYVTLYSICHVTLSTWGQSNLVSCAPPSWLIGRCKKIHPFVAFPSVLAIPNSEPQSYDAWTCFKGQLSNLWIRYHSEVYWAVDLCRLCRLTRSWCQAALCCSPGQRKFQLSGRLFLTVATDMNRWSSQPVCGKVSRCTLLFRMMIPMKSGSPLLLRFWDQVSEQLFSKSCQRLPLCGVGEQFIPCLCGILRLDCTNTKRFCVLFSEFGSFQIQWSVVEIWGLMWSAVSLDKCLYAMIGLFFSC